MLKILKNELYDIFECTMGNCPANCCDEDWIIAIDEEAYERICSLGVEDIHSKITKDTPHVLIKKDHKCPFITKEGLCTIHKNYGADFLSNTCKSYPRFVSGYGDVYTMTLGLSCPEVARLLCKLDRPVIYTEEYHYEDSSEIGRKDLKLPSESVLEGLFRYLDGSKDIFDAFLLMENDVGRVLEIEDISVAELISALRILARDMGSSILPKEEDRINKDLSVEGIIKVNRQLCKRYPFLSVNIVRNYLFERIMYYENDSTASYEKTVARSKIQIVLFYGVLIANSFNPETEEDTLIRQMFQLMRLIDHDEMIIDRLLRTCGVTL